MTRCGSNARLQLAAVRTDADVECLGPCRAISTRTHFSLQVGSNRLSRCSRWPLKWTSFYVLISDTTSHARIAVNACTHQRILVLSRKSVLPGLQITAHLPIPSMHPSSSLLNAIPQVSERLVSERLLKDWRFFPADSEMQENVFQGICARGNLHLSR